MRRALNTPALRLALGNLSPYPDETWVTLDGRHLLVGEMDEAHVRNALRLVLRRRREVRAAMKAHGAHGVVYALRRQMQDILGDD